MGQELGRRNVDLSSIGASELRRMFIEADDRPGQMVRGVYQSEIAVELGRRIAGQRVREVIHQHNVESLTFQLPLPDISGALINYDAIQLRMFSETELLTPRLIQLPVREKPQRTRRTGT